MTMIYLFPGMGATSKMYQGAWSEIRPSAFVEWPSYQGEKSLKALAVRLVAQYGIQDNDILIGSSMGGMVALEISKIVHVSKVLLVGSAINPSEVSPYLRFISPFIDIAPIKIIQKLASRFDNIVLRMFASSEAVFVREMCKAIGAWSGYKGDLTNVIRIHGERDKIIRCPRDCYRIKNGGHLIALTHSRACVDIVSGLI